MLEKFRANVLNLDSEGEKVFNIAFPGVSEGLRNREDLLCWRLSEEPRRDVRLG